MGKPAPTSPFAPASLPEVPSIDGVSFATAQAGIRYAGRTDVLLAMMAPGTTVAGVVTQSKTRSAPVEWCVSQLTHARARALVVNSGNANAFTGKRGVEAVEMTAKAAAAAAGCETSEIFLASTGVIGEPMDASKFTGLLASMAKAAKPDGWHDAARAIMTTDTYPKLAHATIAMEDGKTAELAGFAKGAGMIAPDMATMLAFVFTDLEIAEPLLREAVRDAADMTFNCITVDGDTSTSDTALVFATGKASERGIAPIVDPGDTRYTAFRVALDTVMHDLAQMIVKDGEGLSKHVTISITGAENDRAARRIAFAIANSPIVKTAIAGEDPNWGRIVMAVGKAGEQADRDKLTIWFGPHMLANQGERAADYDEDTAAAYMKNPEIEIRADVGIGTGKATVWTCDLTHGYVSINAEYRS